MELNDEVLEKLVRELVRLTGETEEGAIATAVKQDRLRKAEVSLEQAKPDRD